MARADGLTKGPRRPSAPGGLTPRRAGVAAAAVALLGALWIGTHRGPAGPGRDPSEARDGPTAEAGAAAAHGAEPSAAGQVGGVRVEPAAPDRRAVVQAVVGDGESDPGGGAYTYRWLVNDEEVGRGAPHLALSAFRPGDLVVVEITPAGGAAAATRRSAPVQVVDSPPVVTAVTLAPQEPQPGQPVRAEVKGFDKEGDPITYAYQWEVNGKPVEGARGEVLDGSLVKGGDRVAVVVTPADPFASGSPRPSQPVTTTNRAPEITSLPPAAPEGAFYTYQVSAKDPDGDSVSFKLLQGPDGMRVDAQSGLLQWTPAPVPGGQAHVMVQADDGKGGRSVQTFVVKAE